MRGTHFEHINEHTTEHLKSIPERGFQEFYKPWTMNTDICYRQQGLLGRGLVLIL
jgi:hypothetical protein